MNQQLTSRENTRCVCYVYLMLCVYVLKKSKKKVKKGTSNQLRHSKIIPIPFVRRISCMVENTMSLPGVCKKGTLPSA